MSLIKETGPKVSELKYLVEKLFSVDFYKYITGDITLDVDQKIVLDRAVKEYSTGRPLEYILKKAQFFGLDLAVDDSVLIPRPETEVLVETILAYIKVDTPLTLLDIGTGSANISLSIGLNRPKLKVVAGDISEKALRVAKTNLSNHKCANVLVLGASALSCFKPASFDMILSNPPYVESGYIDGEVSLGCEPRVALDGGNDGLHLIKDILDKAGNYLKKNGLLFLEIGYDQADRVVDYAQKKNWRLREIVKDYSGIERVLVFTCDFVTL